VAREGKRIRTKHLEVRAVASLLHHPRVGFIVPKHTQGSVERNRLKRQLREIVRVDLLSRLGALDVVVRARAEAYDAPFGTLRSELFSAGERLLSLVRAS
jgi:ribonuclease P protein component